MIPKTREGEFLRIKKTLSNLGFTITNCTPVNQGRHLIIHTKTQNFYCLYKHDFFHSFNYQFKDYLKKNNAIGGMGESINKEWLELAIKHNCLLLFVYEKNEGIYYIHPLTVKKFCEENHLIRTQDKINSEQIPYSQSIQSFREVTYSFPVRLMENYLKA